MSQRGDIMTERARLEPHELSEEDKAEWLISVKRWEVENPIDKVAKNPQAFGVAATFISAILLLHHLRGAPLYQPFLYAILFGGAMYYIANFRFVKWARRRDIYSNQLINDMIDRAETEQK